ncbi:MAG TPA: RagB/SusD family nutrient uptake outer membrane protein, partial [bacterium]|nr:RagB/SusD family nutrient uptake outer membrane protein [bacterium]
VAGAWGSAASNWVWGSVTSDDAYKGSNFGDQSPITDIELYNWSTGDAETYLEDKWRAVWEGVVRSNAVLRVLAKVVQSKPGEIPPSDARAIRGEALFLRAHYHTEAWLMWGNIPYYYETDATYRKPALTSAQVAAAIKQDLDTAAALLPGSPRNGDAGRADSMKALAFKGRVQVLSGDYAGGLATLRAVKASGHFALETSFDHVWTALHQYANGKETILAYNASVNDGEPNGNNANWGERLNFPYSGSPFGCCGFHQPSQNLVNFFAVDSATGLPLAFTGAPGAWNANNNTVTAGAAAWLDPRMDWTVGRDNVPYKDWGLHNSTWIRDAVYSGPYSPKKNVQEKACGTSCQSTVGWNSPQLNNVHIHIYRYADALLLLAEAEAMAPGGSLDSATAIVNQIRARAGKTAQGCGTTSDTVVTKTYPTCLTVTSLAPMAVPLAPTATGDSLITPWAKYRIGMYPTFISQATALQAIRYERRLELAMEGKRFFDLRRWGMDSVINNYVTTEKTRRAFFTGAAVFGAQHHLYPIPQIEIDLSRVSGACTLTQNPGWPTTC